MKPNETPNQDLLNELFLYDSESGNLIWKKQKKLRGKIAGGITKNGYVRVRVFCGRFLAHRLIWKMVYGVDPENEIDHINGNPSDNRIENLRECTRSENCMNRGLFKNNSLGMKGVSYHSTMKKFKSTIYRNKEKILIGFFNTADEAYQAYINAKNKFHGEFAYNGQTGVQASKGIR